MTGNDVALRAKERALRVTLSGCESVVIGYSGGVDSAYLAKASLDALGRDRVLAVTGRSPSYPDVQREMAARVAEDIGLPWLEIDTHELDDPDYAANPHNRCYFCKSELYGRLVRVAAQRGYRTVLDGSNADDPGDHRPGLAAARELGVRSPLQEVGLTKRQIRELSRRAGLPTWEAPASPCLASRIIYGLGVTPRRLRQIEEAEAGLRALGAWGDLRVRHHGDWARLELAPGDLAAMKLAALREAAAGAIGRAGFSGACLDLQGYRRGALNEVVGGAAGELDGESGGGASPVPRAGCPSFELRSESGRAVPGVAIVRATASSSFETLLDARRAIVQHCRASGYQYVAVELA